MYRAGLLTALALCAAACATPAPPVADGAAPAPPAAAASGGEPLEPGGEDGVIEVVEVPKAAAVTEAPRPGNETRRVCRREKRTGTNRPVRVCRSLAQIEQETRESKETFDEIRRSQREYRQP